MLTHLHVKNLALIREAEIDFTEGLNILTGETGAGKADRIGDDRAVLPKKARCEARAVRRVRRAGRICPAAQRPVPIYGDQDGLLKLPGTLLSAADARADSRSDAVFRAADADGASGSGDAACD